MQIVLAGLVGLVVQIVAVVLGVLVAQNVPVARVGLLPAGVSRVPCRTPAVPAVTATRRASVP
ncbi:hypothetical protein CIK73_10290 [Brachybacterium alimentarium]|uniref:Uncharacterized protein n=1 Tax=Brachybacterium alimentarium TaxID=47845 RepID=A0A2A3YNJ0_9MICO|nr:hypothetical protein CIK66_01170 [Brachybacterium alimentarium]RCS67617.1 hypothetical protein CIK73_10290 [Brachybacterium alimentarium]